MNHFVNNFYYINGDTFNKLITALLNKNSARIAVHMLLKQLLLLNNDSYLDLLKHKYIHTH